MPSKVDAPAVVVPVAAPIALGDSEGMARRDDGGGIGASPPPPLEEVSLNESPPAVIGLTAAAAAEATATAWSLS